MVREMREAKQLKGAPWYTYLPKTLVILLVSVLASLAEATYKLIAPFFTNPRNINGKVIIVTGSGRGLGRELSLTLARNGAFLACVDINEKNNSETVAMIKSEGGKAQGFTVNVAKDDQVQKLVDDVRNTLGPVDILVNNAALICATRFEQYTVKDFRAQFEVNTLSLAYFLKALIPEMRKRKDCQIVAVSSMSAKLHTPYLPIYSASKAAVTGLMNALRLEIDIEGNPNNLTLSTVHPYFINTSADYMELFDFGLPVLDPSTVVDSIMKTIHYRHNDVSSPSFFTPILSLNEMLPQSVLKYCLTLIRPTVRLKERTFWKDLPYETVLDNTVSND